MRCCRRKKSTFMKSCKWSGTDTVLMNCSSSGFAATLSAQHLGQGGPQQRRAALLVPQRSGAAQE